MRYDTDTLAISMGTKPYMKLHTMDYICAKFNGFVKFYTIVSPKCCTTIKLKRGDYNFRKCENLPHQNVLTDQYTSISKKIFIEYVFDPSRFHQSISTLNLLCAPNAPYTERTSK